jgi:cell division protein ZapB
MISEFHDLSLKIDQLAALTATLRRENAELRQANVSLLADNANFRQRLSEARQRIGALLSQIPLPAADDADHDADAEAEHDGHADPAVDGINAGGAQ